MPKKKAKKKAHQFSQDIFAVPGSSQDHKNLVELAHMLTSKVPYRSKAGQTASKASEALYDELEEVASSVAYAINRAAEKYDIPEFSVWSETIAEEVTELAANVLYSRLKQLLYEIDKT